MTPKTVNMMEAQDWATAQSLVGYTFATELKAGRVNGQVGKATDWPHRYPSVYYERGHATLDHKTPTNIGWEGGSGWNCLFFNNVALADWKAARAARDSGDNATKAAFAAQMNRTYTSVSKNGVWNGGSLNKNGRLVEIWKRPDGEIRVHPSRNGFRWAAISLKAELHSLATNTQIMRKSRHEAREMQL